MLYLTDELDLICTCGGDPDKTCNACDYVPEEYHNDLEALRREFADEQQASWDNAVRARETWAEFMGEDVA